MKKYYLFRVANLNSLDDISMITNERPKRKGENTRRKIEFRTFRFIMRKRKLQWAVPKSFSHLANRPRRIARHTRLNVALVSNVMGTSQHRLALVLIAVKIVPKERKKKEKDGVPDQPWIIKCIFRGSRPTATWENSAPIRLGWNNSQRN